MSPNAAELRGAEYMTTLVTRRLTIAMIGAGSVVGSQFMLATQFEYFPVGQAVVTAAGLLLLPFIVLWRRDDRGAWLGIFAMLTGVFGTTFTATNSDARVSASTALFLCSYFGIVMLRGARQWLWIAVVMVLWSIIVPVVTLPVEIGGTTYNFRWGTLVQLLIASAWSRIAWNREFDLMQARDDLAVRVMRSRSEALATRERVKVWRESLVRVHETVLNDIRSVVDAAKIDGERLLRQLSTAQTQTPPQREMLRLHELVAPMALTQTSGQRLVVGKLPDVSLDRERALALRSSLVELVRNLYRHTAVTSVTIDGIADKDMLTVTLRSDVPVELPVSSQQGIGVGIVLQESLDALGATIERGAHRTFVRLPLVRTTTPPRETVTLDVGRVMLSAVGAGNAIGGAVFYAVLALTYDWHGRVMAACGFFTAVVSIIAVWRRTELPRKLLLVTCVIATLVPIVASQEVHTCARIELPLMITALTSLGLFAVVVWAPSGRWWWVSLPFMLALVYLTPEAMSRCTASVAPPLVAAYSAPVLGIVVLLTSWASARSASRLHQIRLDEVRESAAAAAAVEIGAELHRAVAAAREVLAQVAREETVTNVERIRLRCLDSEIRATIQVDPETAGSLALAAREAIHEAASGDVPVRVLVLRDSGDRRPIPPQVSEALKALLLAATDGSASMQILSNADDDVLSLTISDAARQKAGIDDGWSFAFESGEASLDAGDQAEPALFLVRRRIVRQ